MPRGTRQSRNSSHHLTAAVCHLSESVRKKKKNETRYVTEEERKRERKSMRTNQCLRGRLLVGIGIWIDGNDEFFVVKEDLTDVS